MKIQLKKSILLKIVKLTDGFVCKKGYLPVLKAIKLQFTEDGYKFFATDMEATTIISGSYGDDVELMMPGQITIERSMLKKVLLILDDVVIIEKLDGEFITISSEKRTFKIPYIRAEEYVAIDESRENIIESVDFGDKTLQEGLNNCEYSVTGKNFAPVLTGININISGKVLKMAGTDSFRLVQYVDKLDKKYGKINTVWPIDYIRSMLKIWNKNKTSIVCHISERNTIFEYSIGDLKVATRVLNIQSNFPEYERAEIMPTDGKIFIDVEGKSMVDAIKGTRIMTGFINDYIQIKTNAEEVVIESGKTSYGEYNTSINGKSNQSICFGINGLYIQQFIQKTNSKNVKFQIVSSERPMIITSENKKVKYVIRPLINN